MNIEQLQAGWKSLDEKWQASQVLSERLVVTMLQNQSQSTLSRIRRKLTTVTLFFSGLLILSLAILAGNPFDYIHWFEYIPAALYTLLMVLALKVTITQSMAISEVKLTRDGLSESLRKVIALQESAQVTMKRIWQISVVCGFLFGISLLTPRFEVLGITKSILILTIHTVVVIIMYLVSSFFFKRLPDPHILELKMHLQELVDLSEISPK